MVGVLIRLRLTLLRHRLTKLASAIAFGVGAVGGLAILAIGIPGLVALRDQPLRVTALTVPLLGTLTLLWPVLSVAAGGVDASLDPARFATLPLRARQLVPGLTLTAFVGVPGVVLVGLALAQVGSWSAHPGTLLAGLLAAVVGVLTAVLLSRVATAALAQFMRSRRGREIGAVLVSAITVLPMLLGTAASVGALAPDLTQFDARTSAHVVAWTPVGWAWAIPLDVAEGRYAAAGLHLVAAAVLLAGLVWAWTALVDRALTEPALTTGSDRVRGGRFLSGLAAGSPVGAITARRMRSWRRDSRLVSVAIRTAIVPLVFFAQAVVTQGRAGVPGLGLVMLAILSGTTLMNDLAFDGLPWWLHVACDVRGIDDRLGRVLAAAVVFGPLTIVMYAIAWSLHLLSRPLVWLAVIGAALPIALGVAALVGAIVPGTAPRTGGNPFAAQSGTGAQGCLTALASMAGPVILLVPVIIGSLLAARTGSPALAWAVAGGGIVYGLIICAAGVVFGGRFIDARAPELLERLRTAQI